MAHHQVNLVDPYLLIFSRILIGLELAFQAAQIGYDIVTVLQLPLQV